jgi:hypothetical protein
MVCSAAMGAAAPTMGLPIRAAARRRLPCRGAPISNVSAEAARVVPHRDTFRREATITSAEDGFHVVEHAGGENGLRAFADFLGGLQHDEHVTGGRLSRQQQRGADGPGAVDVVPAGVHDPGRGRREGQAGGFLDWKRVDVTADRHEGRASIAPREPGDDARVRDRPDVDGA